MTTTPVAPDDIEARGENGADDPQAVVKPSGIQRVSTDRQISALLLVGSFAVYIAVLRGRVEVYDTEAMLDVTQNLVNHGSLIASGASYKINTAWSPYGIGVSLLAVPLYALSKLIGHFGFLVSLINPVLTAIAVVVIYRIARALRWSAFHGVVAAVSYGVLSSMALWYSLELLSEPAVTLCILLIILALVRWREGSPIEPLRIGIAAGCAAQFRSDSIFTVWVALLVIPFFVPWSSILTRRTLVYLFGPMGISLAAVSWYDYLRYHKLFIDSYGKDGGYSDPLWHGLYGLLISPQKGLFVFSPLTLVGVAGLVVLLFGSSQLQDRALGTLCVLLIVPRTIFFAKWNIWGGGQVWGARFLLPVAAILSLLMVPMLRATEHLRLGDLLVRMLICVLAVVSAIIGYLSVRVPFGQWVVATRSAVTRAQLGFPVFQSKVQDAHLEQVDFKLAPIWGYITLLRLHLARPSGEWWASGRGGVGYAILIGGILFLLVAAILAELNHRTTRAPV
jgi:hypothetical protein